MALVYSYTFTTIYHKKTSHSCRQIYQSHGSVMELQILRTKTSTETRFPGVSSGCHGFKTEPMQWYNLGSIAQGKNLFTEPHIVKIKGAYNSLGFELYWPWNHAMFRVLVLFFHTKVFLPRPARKHTIHSCHASKPRCFSMDTCSKKMVTKMFELQVSHHGEFQR